MSKISELNDKACNEAMKIANDDSHGYSNVVGHNLGNPDYDCGAFVSTALQRAGILPTGTVFEPNEPHNPWGYDDILTKAGYEKLPFNYANVKRGDILIKDGHHTELALGNGKQVGAHDNYDGKTGDYSHLGEISEVPLSGYWDYMYRLKDTEPKKAATLKCRVYDLTKKRWMPRQKSKTLVKLGTKGHAIGGFAFKINYGKFKYAAMDEDGWLPPVSKYDYKDLEKGMAGNLKPICCIAIWCSDYNVAYRVKDKETQKWYPWVYSTDYNLENKETGYAGIKGREIDGIECQIIG